MTRPKGNDSPDPNLDRQIRGPRPDRTSPTPDDPEKPGMGQGGQPPHVGPGQRPADPSLERRGR